MLLRSAAKVNFTLDILNRRGEGYHELASIVHTIDFWDEIEIEFRAENRFSFECSRFDLQNENNLCVRAARLWQNETDIRFGAHIRLQKNIPTGAGLGGGSANAAAILVALQQQFDSPLSSAKLIELGAKLGADVPLFLQGGALLMEGIGEKITPLAPRNEWLVILKPKLSLPTAQVFEVWKNGGFVSQNATSKLREVWHNGDSQTLAQLMANDLERASARITDLPDQCVRLLLEAGSLGAQMSGSGSACFGVFASLETARNAEQKLREAVAKDVLLQEAHLVMAPLGTQGVELLFSGGS